MEGKFERRQKRRIREERRRTMEVTVWEKRWEKADRDSRVQWVRHRN